MPVGYARAFTQDARLEEQVAALRLAGCKRIFWDCAGPGVKRLDGLGLAISSASREDVLVISSLNQLGRRLLPYHEIVAAIKSRSIDLKTLSEGIDTATVSGLLMFMIAVGKVEDIDPQRPARPKRVARPGIRLGRKPALTPAQIVQAQSKITAGALLKAVAPEFNVTVQTLSKHLRRISSHSF